MSVQQLEVTYPNGVCALAPTSLRIEAGEFVVLLGASGAGKSTLLRCLNGLVTPSAGEIRVDGKNVLASARALRAHRRRTGMVFQQHHLIGRQTVLANVLMGRLGFQGVLSALLPWQAHEKIRAFEAIDRVGLIDRALDRADQLSGGQQQRIGIARALVQSPQRLLADEPVASLDPATSVRLLALLRAICKADGLTAVVSLHQLELAREFADRIVGLREGRVVFDGPPGALTPALAESLYHPPADRSAPRQAHTGFANTHPLGVPS